MIFINYRIADSNTAATFLERELKRVFGETAVFRDKTGIEGGDPWRQVILEHVTGCCAMLVLIGKGWESAKFDSGKYKHLLRLFDPEDWVRLEISKALATSKTVIPILLDGAQMPDKEWLRHFDLQGLSDVQGNALRVDDFAHDLNKLVTLLRKKCPSLPQADLSPVIDSPTAPSEISRSYIESLKKQCADITPFALEPAQGLSVSLLDVYVPPLTNRRFDPIIDNMLPNAKTGKRRGRKPKQPALVKETAEEAKPQLLLSVLGESSLYVSGDPGTGKTTFCRWVAWLTASGQEPRFQIDDPEFQESLPETLRGRLPVLVQLREFGSFLIETPPPGSTVHAANRAKADRPKLRSFVAALEAWVTAPRPGGLCWRDVKSHLDHGSLLLILDGVDEVSLGSGDDADGPSPRELFLAALINAAPDWIKTGNRILITSRPYGLEPDQVRKLESVGLPEARLEPLPDPLQDLLATRWFVALPKTSGEGRDVAAAMLKQARNLSEDVARMTANPLLLTAICVIYSSGKELPQDRHHLYDRIIDAALYSRFPRDKNLIARVRGRLAAIALGMHTGEPIEPRRKSPAREVHESELDAILSAYIQANPETESDVMQVREARDRLLNHSGILLSSRWEHAAFSHWSFQEFLAAERITTICQAGEEPLFQWICESSGLAGWRPTLSFLFDRRVSQLGWPSGTTLFRKMVEQIHQTTSGGPLANALGLATCAADALGILLDRKLNLQEDLLVPFRTVCLSAIEREVDLKPRITLAGALGRIGDPRVANDLRDASNPQIWVTVEADDYPLGDAGIQKEYEKILRSSNYALPPISKPFATAFQISKYPVTNGQFALFLNEKGYDNKSYWTDEAWGWRQQNNVREPAYWQDPRWNGLTQPVVGVSWFEANAFCRWANYRLPKEQEWEAAARGTRGTVYPWGNDWKDGICNTREAEIGVTTPVGSFPGSVAECGAHDLAGNVWEWCEDYWDEKEKDSRVLRGGSWNDFSWTARSAIRVRNAPDFRNGYFGFRVVCCVRTSSYH